MPRLQTTKLVNVSHLIDEIERISQKLNISTEKDTATDQERVNFGNICVATEQPVTKRKRKG